MNKFQRRREQTTRNIIFNSTISKYEELKLKYTEEEIYAKATEIAKMTNNQTPEDIIESTKNTYTVSKSRKQAYKEALPIVKTGNVTPKDPSIKGIPPTKFSREKKKRAKLTKLTMLKRLSLHLKKVNTIRIKVNTRRIKLNT